MSITDELRKWAKEHLSRSSILAIADRIDAEHESACAEAYGNGVMSVPIALDESAWVKLPVDADGVSWNVGDRDEDGNEVFELVLNSDGWYLVNGTKWVNKADSIRHYHAPTVEDVLREFSERVLSSGHQWGLDGLDVIHEYAKRLTLAEGEDA